MENNDEDHAIQDLKLAVERTADNGAYAMAIQEYTAAIDADPTNASLFLGRGAAKSTRTT